MGEWREIPQLLKLTKTDISVWLVTFALTVFADLTVAVEAGMNPLSFVAFFTIGELAMMSLLALVYSGGALPLWHKIAAAKDVLFWLMLGGFVWVIGDIFQQYAAKYVGISRGIPLSNTNQLWGLAWGILVFGEFRGRGASLYVEVIVGSLIMDGPNPGVFEGCA